MNDRDMYYGSYGYGGFMPNQQVPIPNINTPNLMPNTIPQNSYTPTQFNDLTERINRLERQVKRLDQRLTRLETPYANKINFQENEPDNNMYMM